MHPRYSFQNHIIFSIWVYFMINKIQKTFKLATQRSGDQWTVLIPGVAAVSSLAGTINAELAVSQVMFEEHMK